MHVCMYVCIYMYVCMYVCMYACMHVCMYACMHVCMFVCLYVCMYVCKHIFTVPRGHRNMQIFYQHNMHVRRSMCVTHTYAVCITLYTKQKLYMDIAMIINIGIHHRAQACNYTTIWIHTVCIWSYHIYIYTVYSYLPVMYNQSYHISYIHHNMEKKNFIKYNTNWLLTPFFHQAVHGFLGNISQVSRIIIPPFSSWG